MTGSGRPHRLAQDAVERAIDRAAGSRPIPGNRVELLFDGPAAFEQMLDLLARAERWIHFDNYIFRDDRTGRRFAEALMARAQAGVRVRLSVDWLGSYGTRRRLWRDLVHAGVAVHRFNRPALFDLPSVLSRNHRKLVVADGCRAVLGGICIGDEWAGDPVAGRLPWRDTAVLVEGPAAGALDRAFATTWAESGEALPPDELAGDVPAAGTASVRVLAGEPARERAYRVSELLLASAGQRVWVTDAYLVAPRRLFRYLLDAAAEGVDVRLLVPGSSDIALVRNLTRIGYRDLLAAGVRIFEWAGPMLHAKTVVADGRWVRIGSSNLNHSSLVANYELDVLVEDEELGARMEAQYRRDLDESAEVSTRPSRMPARLRQALPPVLRIQAPETSVARHRQGLRERRGRSVLAVRTLVAGARVAVFGPLAAGLAAIGVLFFILPRAMGLIFGIACIWLAAVAGAEALRRRREKLERTR
ncbi:MAG: phosphatidylserine/phosphatidylglycerophosphate/cardiolipin synthase family protein [Gemmatimonadales bacterium]